MSTEEPHWIDQKVLRNPPRHRLPLLYNRLNGQLHAYFVVIGGTIEWSFNKGSLLTHARLVPLLTARAIRHASLLCGASAIPVHVSFATSLHHGMLAPTT